MRPLALAPVVPRVARSAGIPLRLERPEATLTFDDGPHPSGTPAVLASLARADVRAIFFLVGEQVVRYPDIAAQVAAAGHELGLHGFSHRVQLRLTARAIADDYERGMAAIEDATGNAPTWHRPPLGIYSEAGLRRARERGLDPLLWSRWGKDWRKWTTPERIARRATSALCAGDVILLHDADHYSSKDSWQRTVGALPAILAELQPTGSGSGSSTGVSATSHS